MKKLSYILVFVLSALVIVGIVIGIVLLTRQSDFDKKVTLTGDGVVQAEMKCSLEGLYPGQSAEYSICFSGAPEEAFALTVAFQPDDAAALSPYIDVELELNGESVAAESLDKYLKGDTAEVTLPKGEERVLIVRYSMPEEIGNEAQGLAADFVLALEARPA